MLPKYLPWALPCKKAGLEKPDPNKIGLIPGEGILLRPTLFLEVGHDMTTDDGLGVRSKKGNGLADARFVVPQTPVPHLIGFPALKFIQPEVDFLVRPAEQGDGFLTVFFEGSHIFV
jgi:hypothetical protein